MSFFSFNYTKEQVAPNNSSLINIFDPSLCEPDLVHFVGYSTDDGLVSEVEMEPLKIHLPVNPLITMCLGIRNIDRLKIT